MFTCQCSFQIQKNIKNAERGIDMIHSVSKSIGKEQIKKNLKSG